MLFLLYGIVLPAGYFLVSWFVPWDQVLTESSISLSYVFDVFFAALVFLFCRKRPQIGKLNKYFTLRFLVVLMLAIFSIFLSRYLELSAPFKYVEHYFIQLLILAPILEELVFRGAFFSLFESLKMKSQHIVFLTSSLFAFSHLSALFFLPEDFHSFIFFQVFYTFFLGHLCGKSRLKTNGLVAPILHHFGFNLVFCIAVHFYQY